MRPFGRGLAIGALALAACGAEAATVPVPERTLDPPRPIAPPPGPTGRTTLRPRFVWRPVASADHYELEIAACAGGVATCAWSVPIARGRTTEWSWRPADDLARGRVAWRVRACADRCSPWTRPRWLDVGRAVGDLDGDGYSDAIAGAPLVDLGGRDRGAVVIAHGPHLIATRLDEPDRVDGAEFGAALADADVDADGKDDLIVGAPGSDDGTGRAYVYGRPTGGPTVALGDPTGKPGDAFGAAIVAADFDGDGYADLAIAAPGADGAQPDDRDVGRVLVWRGGPTGVIASAPRALSAPVPEPWDRFGAALAAGDVNGDGYADLIVGAPGLDRIGARRGVDRGAVYVYRGSDDGVLAVATRLEAPVPLDHDRFGYALAAADIDGDGRAELLVGAPSADSGGGDDGGLVYVFGGDASGDARASGGARAPERVLSGADAVAVEGARFERFGSAVAIAGDLDGDGYVDVIVGTSAPGRGLALVYRGSREGIIANPLELLRDDAAGADADDFGDSVAGAGDIDGDGLADVLVGAASARRDGQRQGSILVFRGVRGGVFATPLRVDGPAEQAHFGRSLAGR